MPKYRFTYESTRFYEQIVDAPDAGAAAELIREDKVSDWQLVTEEHGKTNPEFVELDSDGEEIRDFTFDFETVTQRTP